jgi:hypothetical protein
MCESLPVNEEKLLSKAKLLKKLFQKSHSNFHRLLTNYSVSVSLPKILGVEAEIVFSAQHCEHSVKRAQATCSRYIQQARYYVRYSKKHQNTCSMTLGKSLAMLVFQFPHL